MLTGAPKEATEKRGTAVFIASGTKNNTIAVSFAEYKPQMRKTCTVLNGSS